ncbi:helix-turn-helix transcriptional regulator [Symbioplanes lichenis]|uniref:helix-turn-helix transcriptional regulator n=1 Tax=Symbioplanes lichenis TaxID=1629072 RepID=UPI0027391FCA|nr:LuxR C-terminal-related transcriptional regulator [Actinoplanes lichenis]
MTVTVAVRGTDPLRTAGLAGLIGAAPELTLVPGTGAEVLVWAAPRLDDQVVPHLRRPPAAASHGAAGVPGTGGPDQGVSPALPGLGVPYAPPVVLVVDELGAAELPLAVECGVMGVLPRRAVTAERLVHAVRAAAEGAAVLPPRLVGDLLQHLRELHDGVLREAGMSAGGLTGREVEVVRMMAEGLETTEIGVKLGYSERTVKTVIHGMIQRLGLRNRPHIVAYAMRYGLL